MAFDIIRLGAEMTTAVDISERNLKEKDRGGSEEMFVAKCYSFLSSGKTVDRKRTA